MIPKIIHYCWFGQAKMSTLELNCLESWKKHLPDYQIKCWNESNFDYSAFAFSAKAYQLGKFAFVSDVCRLYALFSEGGIYLDTDMVVLKDFEDLLDQDLFMGEEKEGLISAGIIGTTKNNSILAELLNIYSQMKFDYESPLDIPTFLTLNLDRDRATIYPKEYFYPLPFSKRVMDYKSYVQSDTYAVHLWNHSWKNEWHYLHDKNFGKALREFVRNFFSGSLTQKKLLFPIQFCKYYLAHLLPRLYGQVKSIGKD